MMIRRPGGKRNADSICCDSQQSRTRSFIEADISYWCSDGAIYCWLTSRPGYKLYCERVIPLLSDAQEFKHYQFAQHFRNNWGLGKGKYLLIEYDKKWFWGLVMCRGAKSCADLGIHPELYKAYHKSHISKTMGVAFTAFAFEDNIENGGKAIKLGFFFCALSYKITQKMVQESVCQPDGKMKQCGPVLRQKGDKYLITWSLCAAQINFAQKISHGRGQPDSGNLYEKVNASITAKTNFVNIGDFWLQILPAPSLTKRGGWSNL